MDLRVRPGPPGMRISSPGTLHSEQPTKGVGTMSTAIRDELPFEDEHGESAVWDIKDRDGHLNRIEGTFLGMGSTNRPEHKGHPDTEFAPRGVHCSTCRWTEIRVFQGTDSRLYAVHCGASDVPGERDLIRVSSVSTPFELVESLVTTDRSTGRNMLPMPARRALAQAASHSPSLRDAYINSPVT